MVSSARILSLGGIGSSVGPIRWLAMTDTYHGACMPCSFFTRASENPALAPGAWTPELLTASLGAEHWDFWSGSRGSRWRAGQGAPWSARLDTACAACTLCPLRSVAATPSSAGQHLVLPSLQLTCTHVHGHPCSHPLEDPFASAAFLCGHAANPSTATHSSAVVPCAMDVPEGSQSLKFTELNGGCRLTHVL